MIPTNPAITRQHLGYKRGYGDPLPARYVEAIDPEPEPLPAAWANYKPDSSLNTYLPTPRCETVHDITHAGLTKAIRQGQHTVNSQYWRSEYVGRMDLSTQQSIMQWMRDRGSVGGQHTARIATPHMDLHVSIMGRQTTIELIDYCSGSGAAPASSETREAVIR